MTNHHDVIIIGGGIAGLIAARELSHREKNTCLLEATPRLGGRILTTEFAGRNDIELGATWVHWSHPHVWSEMSRYSLEYAPDRVPDISLVSEGGNYRAVPFSEAMSELKEMLSRFFSGLEDSFPTPYHAARCVEAFRSIDGETITERLNKVSLPPKLSLLAESYFPSLTGETNEEAGLATLTHWWCCAGANPDMFLQTFEGGRIVGGYSKLVEAVHQDIRGRVRTNCPVTQVSVESDGATVVLESGESLRANHIIMAVPLNSLGNIALSPSVPELDRVAQGYHGGARQGHKYAIHVEGELPWFQAILSPEKPLNLVFSSWEVQGGQVLGAYTRPGSNPPGEIDIHRTIIELVPDIKIVSLISYPWVSDRYFKGLWTYRKSSKLTEALTSFCPSEPVGGVWVIGADVSHGLNWVDGAIASALSTSHELLHRI